jgi:hypothetical protein
MEMTWKESVITGLACASRYRGTHETPEPRFTVPLLLLKTSCVVALPLAPARSVQQTARTRRLQRATQFPQAAIHCKLNVKRFPCLHKVSQQVLDAEHETVLFMWCICSFAFGTWHS